jgi:AcrR family transcriptional regulator
MPRTEGARDARHAERRRAMIDRMRARLGEAGATHASWRELAAAAGVGLSTLTHYFGRRDDVVRAVMEQDLEDGAEPLAVMALPTGPFERSIRDAVSHLAAGLSFGGLSRTFATGLVQCLRHPSLGPAFLDMALEPTIRTVEARLQAHIDRGEMQGDPRAAALMLISPLLVAHLHQHELGGTRTRPLDLESFGRDVADRFIRAYGSSDGVPDSRT